MLSAQEIRRQSQHHQKGRSKKEPSGGGGGTDKGRITRPQGALLALQQHLPSVLSPLPPLDPLPPHTKPQANIMSFLAAAVCPWSEETPLSQQSQLKLSPTGEGSQCYGEGRAGLEARQLLSGAQVNVRSHQFGV